MSQDKKPEVGLNAIPAAQEAMPLLSELRQLIDEARYSAVVAVNAGLTLLYWRVGQRIRVEVLGGERAGYGKEIVSTLSRQLVAEFGRSFSDKNLRRMVQFAEVFADEAIVVTLLRQLGWSHFLSTDSAERPAGPRLLRRNVPHRALECAHSARAGGFDAV